MINKVSKAPLPARHEKQRRIYFSAVPCLQGPRRAQDFTGGFCPKRCVLFYALLHYTTSRNLIQQPVSDDNNASNRRAKKMLRSMPGN